jgi:predicted Zn-dependent protease
MVSERKDLPWAFHVVDDPGVNAFALPGGFIYITRGLLAHLENEAQLASVLGHEIGHVTAQHSVNQLSKAQLAQFGLGLGAAVSDSVRQLGGLGAQGLQLMFLKFGRDDEREADDLGIRYALRAGYDVREMPKVFAVLGRVSEGAGGSRLPAWLQTHPESGERVKRSEQKIAALEHDFEQLEIATEPFMGAIDGIVFGENPRMGFFKDSRFYHPELAFSVDIPGGFEAVNTRQAVVASSPEGDAAVQLTAVGSVPAERALASFAQESGVSMREGARKLGPGVAGSFAAETEDGPIGGLAFFVEQAGHTYMMLGFADARRYSHYEGVFAKSFASFSQVHDEAILDIGPNRLQTEKLSSPMRVEELAQEHRALDPQKLAVLNQAELGEQLPAGSFAKWVSPAER